MNTEIRGGGGLDTWRDRDAALRDPRQPSRLLAELDSGDGLHPNGAGCAAMSDAVNLADLVPGADTLL